MYRISSVKSSICNLEARNKDDMKTMYRILIIETSICHSKARTYYDINGHVSFSTFFWPICRAKYCFQCDIWGPRIDAILGRMNW